MPPPAGIIAPPHFDKAVNSLIAARVMLNNGVKTLKLLRLGDNRASGRNERRGEKPLPRIDNGIC